MSKTTRQREKKPLPEYLLGEFFADISTLEYAMRKNKNAHKMLVDNPKSMHGYFYPALGWASRFMQAFPKSKDRNRLVKQLLHSDITGLQEAMDFLREKGQKKF